MWDLLKDYLDFSRKQRRATLILSVLIVLSIIIPRLYMHYHQPPEVAFAELNPNAQEVFAQWDKDAAAQALQDSLTGMDVQAFVASGSELSEIPTLININTADASTLTKLKGIGDSYAQKIVEYREKYGPFKTKEQIMEVKGIGEVTFENIKDFITLE